ncbi:MAG TPA: serine hydrolase domain-containing protein [Saprospiraceae bacterium]|nr:serine hydrolase domain-containing protein [Saprospiraceae bacterium]
MKFRLTLLIVFITTILRAQTPSLQNSPFLTYAHPSSVGMSPERLERIDNMLSDAVKRNEIPGVVALIVRNGKIVYHKAHGSADATTNRLLKTDDIFRIASQTKGITSTAVMMLWEEGKFRLDDPISKYIPEFAKPQVLDSLLPDGTYTTKPANKEITIRHLITHTSGLGYGMIDGDPRFKSIYSKAGITDLFSTENISIGESVKKLAKLPLHHHPGEKYTYSEGLDVLGYFIEVVSGMPLDEFFKTRIFDPLQMNDTRFYLPDAKKDRLVSIQTKKDNKWIPYPVTFYDPDYPIKGAKKFFSGGAGLSSTAKDYATFLQMYLNGGEINGIRLLSRTTIKTMMSNQVGDLRGVNSGSDYGLAFGLVDANGQAQGGRGSEGTFDWGGYFNTQYFADPKEEIIGIIMKQTQAIFGDETSWKFKQMVFQAVDD